MLIIPPLYSKETNYRVSSLVTKLGFEPGFCYIVPKIVTSHSPTRTLRYNYGVNSIAWKYCKESLALKVISLRLMFFKGICIYK